MQDSLTDTRVRLEYFFDRSNYAVAPQGAVAVTVFLRETFNPKEWVSLLAPGGEGLVHGGVLVDASTAAGRPARVKSVSAIAGNPAFDFALIPQLSQSKSASSAGILGLSSDPVFGEVVSKTATSETVLLPLGTFIFTADHFPGDVTFLTAMIADNIAETPGHNVVTTSGIVLDPVISTARAVITVSPKPAVPHLAEDASGLAGVLGSLANGSARRKW